MIEQDDDESGPNTQNSFPPGNMYLSLSLLVHFKILYRLCVCVCVCVCVYVCGKEKDMAKNGGLRVHKIPGF
jgi:hypothetical protein